MTELDDLRTRILEIDEAMLRLWRERDDAARRIGRLKQDRGLPLQNFEVEKAVLGHALATASRLGVPTDRAQAFTRLLIETALLAQERERARGVHRDGRRALILGGAGLMGSWFAKFLEEQGFAVYVRDLKETPYPAPSPGDRFDVVLIATPPSTVGDLLPEAAALAKADGVVLDIASVKGAAASRLRELAASGKPVASLHPMFGPSVDVLMGRNVLVLDCGQAEATRRAGDLFSATAAKTRELPLELHDHLMAEILGLSHATSIAFNQALVGGPFPFHELEPAASTTFRKQVDVSREVARENPRLYYEIQSLNPESVPMLRRLEAAVTKLRTTVERKDRLGFVDLMHRANAYYQGVGLRSR